MGTLTVRGEAQRLFSGLASSMTQRSKENARAKERLAYETLLANCCHYDSLCSLLSQHRPYFESLPSIRRLQESMVIIPLPNVRSREKSEIGGQINTLTHIRPLPCDVAVMICDPEWKIKTGIEIVLIIQRPGEDLSDLLYRWRQIQVELGQGVEWLMPRKHRHLLAEGTAEPHPLFVVFTCEEPDVTDYDGFEPVDAEAGGAKTVGAEIIGFVPDCFEREMCDRAQRILHGLNGARLPIATQSMDSLRPLTPQ